MKNTSIMLILFIGLIQSACNLSNKKEELSLDKDFKFIKVNNDYGIHVPDYMKETKDLNNDASLQYANVFKETYVIVIDESKDEFIDTFTELEEYDTTISPVKNYRDVQLKMLIEGMDVKYKSDPMALSVNGLNAETVELDAQVEGIKYDIGYFITFIEGTENLYMIMEWTLQNRKEKYRTTFDQIARSFRLLDDGEEESTM